MFDIGYKAGEIVKHDDVCKRAGCGCMGGIRFSKKNNVVLLFTKQNSNYDNSWKGDIFRFMGSGKSDQSIESKGNIRIAESSKNDTALCLFEWLDAVNLKYVGRMILTEAPYYETRKNKYGEKEKKVLFNLKKA